MRYIILPAKRLGLRQATSSEAKTCESIYWGNRSGNDEHAIHCVQPCGPDCRRGAKGARADLSAAGVGRAQPTGDLVPNAGSNRRGSGEEWIGCPGFGGDWNYEPARNNGCLGKGDRKAGDERDCVARHARGGGGRQVQCGRRSRPVSSKDWVAAEYVF